MKEQVKTETVHSGVCAAVLLIAAFTQWQYFMYVLLRVFICSSSAYIASRLYSRHHVPLTWLFGAIAVLFNPVLPVRMARSDWQATNALAAIIFIAFSVYLNWDSLSRRQWRKTKNNRLLVRAVAAICKRMHSQEIRILELDPADSARSDFFVVTSAADHQHAITIANEIELRLKNDWGLSKLLDGRTCGWILLDYVDFEVHIFLKEQRAYYDIEMSRKSAKSFTPTEFEATIKRYRSG
jgi:ribosome-associated protein